MYERNDEGQGTRTYLSGDELRGSAFTEAKRGGVDRGEVDTTIERAAATIDGLQHSVDTLQRERAELIDELDVARRVDPPSAQAARLLDAASTTAEELIAQATAEAAAIRSRIGEERARVDQEVRAMSSELAEAKAAHRAAVSVLSAEQATELRDATAAHAAELARLIALRNQWHETLTARRNAALEILHGLEAVLDDVVQEAGSPFDAAAEAEALLAASTDVGDEGEAATVARSS